MKIVILDDSLTVRMIIESFLEDFGVEDDEMFSFENGHEAVEFIRQNGADIVFTDINMPKMNGYEFAKLVFENKPNLKSSFFAISGDESPESYADMKKVGVQRFLKKPINDAHFRHFVLPEILKRRK
ncbi:response regulator [Sulfurimonas sp.]|uniref:response regulator n=1 Tax=Sulfurimonas sp. TaxID=2022749 RepID=UPI0035666CA9